MMANILGIDQSVNHTGVCVLDSSGDTLILKLIEPKSKLPLAKKLIFLREELTEIINNYSPLDTAIVEDYSYNSVGRKYDLGAIMGVILVLSEDFNFPVIAPSPRQRAKFAAGKGNADKETVRNHVNRKWNQNILNDNLADAYTLARIGYELSAWNTTTRHELEVLNAISSKGLKATKPRAIKVSSDSI